MTGRRWALLLFPVLLGLGVVLFLGLSRNPSEIPSPLVGKPFPKLAGVDLNGEPRQLPIPGKPMLVNVWASWCTACGVEHPVIVAAAKKYSQQVEFIGLNYRDKQPDATRWLSRLGNPYAWSLNDAQGRAGIELGVYGAPETYFVDAEGVIQDKKIGPLEATELVNKIHKITGITN